MSEQLKRGSRVITDQWSDLRYERGTVKQIDRGWAQVLWDRVGLGASWVPVTALQAVP